MKIHDITIENFRGFSRFELKNLGQVNLLVGTNNSGKTTVLEAINILSARGRLATIWSTLSQRGENFLGRNTAGEAAEEFDVSRLFRGRQIEVGSLFRLTANTDRGEIAMTAEVTESRPGQFASSDAEPDSIPSPAGELFSPLSLSLHWSAAPEREIDIPIKRLSGILSLAWLRFMSYSMTLISSGFLEKTVSSRSNWRYRM